MTNLEANRRIERDYRRYAEQYAAAGDTDNAAYWTKMADFCAMEIAGIEASGDDEWIPF